MKCLLKLLMMLKGALGVRIMRPALTFISTWAKKNCLGSDFKLTIREIGCMCIEASHM